MQELTLELFNVLEINTNLLLKISDKRASQKFSADKWSRKEILGHLIDSALVNHIRFIRSLSKHDLVFEGYPQDEWVNVQNYNFRNWGELIELWKSVNLHIAELINNIPKEKLLSFSEHHNFNVICFNLVETDKESSLNYLVKDYLAHLNHHLNQIFTYKEK